MPKRKKIGFKNSNITVRWGDPKACFDFKFHLDRTIKNRIKMRVLCFFFPFKLERWDD